MKNRWWIILMILACLLWAVSCAQRGAAEVMQIGSPAAAEGPVTVEDEVPAADPENNDADDSPAGRPPQGMLPFTVRGEGKDLAALGHAPEMTAAGSVKAVRPSCTWTNEGSTMIACGMGPLDLVRAGLLETVPSDLPDAEAELVFEAEPDRVTVRFALLSWDGNGELLTSDEDFIDVKKDGTYGDYLVTRENAVVEITAEWDERDGYGGHAIYVFLVGEVKQ